jgi:hypothetical protein
MNSSGAERMKHSCDYLATVSVRDSSQENVMNAHGSFYSGFVDNQPIKIITINTKQTKSNTGEFHKKVLLEGK